MDKKFLKKIIAQSQEDLQIISAICSEAKIKINDIKYLPSNKIFLIFLSRYNNEDIDNKRLINSIVKFEFIETTKSKNINQNNPDLVLELLAINVFKKDYNFEITLLFSKNRIITLIAEVIEVTLEDQKLINDKNTKL
tara:strand:- start:121 stop:534 length:414 start_codon:yes stop_codon:yes gene_type:complete